MDFRKSSIIGALAVAFTVLYIVYHVIVGSDEEMTLVTIGLNFVLNVVLVALFLKLHGYPFCRGSKLSLQSQSIQVASFAIYLINA